MPKARRKATNTGDVSPRQLWDLFHAQFPDGFDRYDLDRLGPKLVKDLGKVSFDFENCEYDHLEEELGRATGFLGYRKFWTRSPLTCFSYIGFSAGGDWEYPVKFLIYMDQDGKTFRGYVPQEGNVWNYDTKQAIGNDEDADSEFLKKWTKKWRPDIYKECEENNDWTFESDDADILDDPLKMAQEMMFRFEAV